MATHFDVILVDVTLPPYVEKDIHSGEDVVLLAKKWLPNAKIVMLTSHCESIILYKILEKCNPTGLLVKSDFLAEEFLLAFDTIVRGEPYFSATIKAMQHEFKSSTKIMDNYNTQIIILLSQGLKTKTLQDRLNLSKSAIDKRKSMIKDYFGIEKGSDEDIVREARKKGLI